MLSRFGRFKFLVATAGLMTSLVLAPIVAALSVPPQPKDAPIIDQTNTLNNEQKAALAKLIADERAKSGNQIAMVMIPSLEGESIENYSLAIAREWGIGTRENNNGVLLLIAKDDRQLRIEVGSGLEGALTDVRSGQIIRNDITPFFKKNQFYEGIQAGVSAIIASIHGEHTATEASNEGLKIPWQEVILVVVGGIMWLGSILSRTKSWWAGGIIGGLAGGVIGIVLSSLTIGLIWAGVLMVVGLIFDMLVSANYRSRRSQGRDPSWWAGGGTLGGGSSDGFGGFGGGGFGGGGSSGSW